MTWNFGESPPTIVIVSIYIRGCMYQGYDIGKNRKAHCIFGAPSILRQRHTTTNHNSAHNT